MTLGEIARLCGASHMMSDDLASSEPRAFAIDSRSVGPGDLFIAIAGENTDGHKFIDQVFDNGALGAIVTHRKLGSLEKFGERARRMIFVENTVCALAQLAARVISSWQGQVVAITASAGKTTIKDLTAGVLEGAGRVIKSHGNLNTTIGLPLAVSRMISEGERPGNYDYAVLEMGMNTFGEIARLTDIAPPHIGVVGNVGTAHIEFFGSQEGIARAKAELIDGIRPGGIGVLNADDARVIAMASRRRDLRIVSFGINEESHIAASEVRTEDDLSATRFNLKTPEGETAVVLRLAGLHNVYNALAAAAVGHSAGLGAGEIARLLSAATPLKMRGEVIRFENGVTVVDDTYNSNPAALMEAVRAITSARGFKRRIVVAGEMLELGDRGSEMHRECGRAMARSGVSIVVGVRGLASELVEAAAKEGAKTFYYETPEEAAGKVAAIVRAGDIVLVKGSRGVKTEKVVENLRSRFDVEKAG